MLSTIGSVAVTSALLGAAVVAVCGIRGGFRRNPALLTAARYGTWFVFICASVAVATMEVALLTHDFSVEYVARVGNRATPPYYTAISLWSSLDGSILFWGWILAAYAALVAWVYRPRGEAGPLEAARPRSEAGTLEAAHSRPARALDAAGNGAPSAATRPASETDRLAPFVSGVLMIVGIFFFGLLVGPANPFGSVWPVPSDGPGPNPLLQNHPLMGLHPPMLYLGYVGLSVPFAFAIGALLAGRVDAGWVRATRRWTLAAWAFLSVGIVAGAWWSYEVLGWGGYWAWDPVENASFLPWLTATAFLHSVMVQERRGMLKMWNLSLVIGTFLLTLFGTFLTRSGILDSVHAFTEGLIGPIFLGFIALVALVSLCLIAWRSDRLYAAGALDAVVSRESAFVLNNVLFVAFTFTVLLGTVFPLFVEAVEGERVSVGAPYFNTVTVPIGLLILFLMGVGPALPWRRTSPEGLRRTFWVPAAAGVAVLVLALALGVREPYPLVTFAFAGFAMATIVEEFRKGLRARRRISGAGFPGTVVELLARNGRRYGGYVVHAGIVVIIVALSISGTWRFEREATLARGETLRVGDYDVRFESVWGEQQPQRFVVSSTFRISEDGEPSGRMSPSLNFYPASEQPIATPAVRSTPAGDLYLTLMAFDAEQGSHATVRAIVNPAVPWLWIGGMIVALGALIAIWPRRRTVAAIPLGAVRDAGSGGPRAGSVSSLHAAGSERADASPARGDASPARGDDGRPRDDDGRPRDDEKAGETVEV